MSNLNQNKLSSQLSVGLFVEYQIYLQLECPHHGIVDLRSLAADILFLDIDPALRIDEFAIKRGRLLGRGAFGFVFRAHVKTMHSVQPYEVRRMNNCHFVKIKYAKNHDVNVWEKGKLCVFKQSDISISRHRRKIMDYRIRHEYICR